MRQPLAAGLVRGSGSGVAKFEVATLEQFLRSHEDTTTVPKCKGLVRPVFEMKAGSGQQAHQKYTLQPDPQNALWLFTIKKFEVPGNGFVFLG